MIISYLVVKLTANTGINLSQYAEGFAALGYSADIYPQIIAGFFGIVTVLIISNWNTFFGLPGSKSP